MSTNTVSLSFIYSKMSVFLEGHQIDMYKWTAINSGLYYWTANKKWFVLMDGTEIGLY